MPLVQRQWYFWGKSVNLDLDLDLDLNWGAVFWNLQCRVWCVFVPVDGRGYLRRSLFRCRRCRRIL